MPLPKGKINLEDKTMKENLKQFDFYDGEDFVTFVMLHLDLEKRTTKLAISDRGKISVVDYDLLQTKNGEFYFEYVNALNRIMIEYFDEFITKE